MTKTSAFLLTMVGTVLLDGVAAWLPLPALWGRVHPVVVVRLLMIAGIAAMLPRAVGIGKTVLLLATATVLPTVLWVALYILTGRAAAAYSGPAIVLAFVTWAFGSGIVGALVGALVRRLSGSGPSTA